MSTFTLDTNCIIAIDEGRPEAHAIRALANAHADGKANVAIVAISASEKQKGSSYIDNFTKFQERLSALNLDHLDILPAMFYFDITFWDRALLADEAAVELERKIHDVMFPGIEFDWRDFCRVKGLDPNGTEIDKKWRNAKCDVQALWSHIHHGRNIFVTSDGDFHGVSEKQELVVLGANRIEYPDAAARLI